MRAHTAAPLVLLGALSTFGPVSLDVYLPALPELAGDLDASTAAAQLTLTACLVGLAFGQVVAGPLSDQVGRRRPLLAALGAFTVASALCALAPTIEVLLVLRFAQGFAGGASIVIARATVRDVHEGDDAARAFSTLILIQGVAPVAAPAFGGQVLRVTDWRGAFVLLAGFGLLLGVVAWRRAGETRPARVRSGKGIAVAVGASLRDYRRLLADPDVLRPALTLGACSAALFAYVAGSSFALQEQYDLSAQFFSLVFAGVGLSILVVGNANRRMVGRIAPRTLLRAGAIQMTAGGALLLLAVVVAAPLALVVGALLVAIASIGLVFPNATTLAMAGHPEAAGSAGALLGLLQFLSGGLAAPLVGLGGDVALSMAVVITAGGLVATVIACTHAPRRAGVAAP